MNDCYLGCVDWKKDYKHVLKVNDSSQFDDVMEHMNTHSHKPVYLSDINVVKIVNGSGVIQLDGFYRDFHIYNYVLFRNTENRNFFYAFIDSLEFKAKKTTLIHFSIDVWQMYTGSIRIFRSYMERMHIRKSDDVIGRWLAPEPFNFEKSFESVLGITQTDFTPRFLVESVSRPIIGNQDFEYGGQALGASMEKYTPLYAYKVTSPQQIQNILKMYEADLTQLNFIDHRQDIIGCYLIPAFIYSQLANGETWGAPVAGDETIATTETLSINPNTLACGYTPKNKKLLTSLCKKYVLFNRNGFRVEMVPELFTGNSLQLEFSGRGFDNDSIKLIVGGYRFYSKNTFRLPYSGSFPICYNENSGVTKQLNVLKSVVGGVTGGLSGSNIVSSTENIMNSAFGSQGSSVGSSSGDYLSLTNRFFSPRLADVSPSVDDCIQIDDYLTTYGYQINEIVQPSLSNRSNWCYLKGDVSFTCDCLENDHDQLSQIFKNGVTVWQSPTTFLDYSQSNN